jgi:hypothetical protein
MQSKIKLPKIKSSVIYSGPSLIDGKPIVVVAIVKSSNQKTSDMVQTYIIRSDIAPMTASKTGEDYSICGNCTHRGKPTDDASKKQAVERSCYVTLYHGPSAVYRAFKRGAYPMASNYDITRLGAGRMVRLGTYGDPLAVDSKIWDNLLSDALGHTGYSHQLGLVNGDYSKVMISADNQEEAKKAHKNRMRTFRVIPVRTWNEMGKASLMGNEILCPASKEMDYRTTCDKCKLCAGGDVGKSIAIVSHGTSRNMFKAQ